MTFATANLAASLAAYLAPYFPGVTFYPGPNQQGTEPPCMFLQQRYNYPDLQQDGRRRLRIGLDLAYLLDYNLPNMQLQYQEAADTLNVVMETFPYSDGADTALLRTYDKEARIDLDALHYKFEVRVWVSLPETPVMMQTMDYTEDITNGQT
jgi:hypothetical protein